MMTVDDAIARGQDVGQALDALHETMETSDEAKVRIEGVTGKVRAPKKQ